MLIAIDHGNSRIKTPLTSFVSGYTKYGTEPPMMAKDVIRFGDSFYALTETRLPYQFNKTQTEDFYLLTLFAIAKEITAREAYQPEETEIELAVGLPPIHYGFLKKPFTDYLMRGQEPVRFSYNGKPFCVRVTRVLVYPQAYAAIATRLTELQGKAYVAVVDIGGFTADTLVLRHGKLDMEYCNSLELGIIKLYNKAEQKGIAKFGYKIQPEDVDDILLHRCDLPENIQALVRDLATNHVIDIIDRLRERDMDIRAQPVVFVGGGSRILQESILTGGGLSPKRATFISNGNANAVGYYTIAKAMLEQEKRMARA